MLRKRKNRRYNETNDEEGDGERKFDILLQVKCERFDQIREKHLLELDGNEVTLQYVQRHGFDKPILIAKPEGLDLRVPPKSFLVRDVRNCVGQQRVIDVMDVKTQKNIEMSMKDWCKYYESKSRDRLLNVISLEFSHTKLDELVESPMIVRLLDWVDLVWPKFLKESQTESTNTIDKMKYPKVQKYCLMSVKGSYTDFHIDFGGTSVWYHILRGKKIFWMVPPTELNLQTFEEWTLSGQQQDVFFGDTVEECFRVELNAGNTFFIPSGWIHAVYTLEDSLVFGGNFLHSFGMENQLKVSKIEDATKVPIKFRYPFYTEILWYVVQHYVHCLTQKDHLHRHQMVNTSSSSIKAEQSLNESIKNEKKQTEIEDESTESEPEESESKKRKPTSSCKRKLRAKASAKSGSSKKTTKTPVSDDDSTDIESSNEDITKPAKISPTNTCRMTKNSLLRLQYEIEEQELFNNSSKTSTKVSSTTPKNQKKKPDSTPPSAQSNNPTVNLAEIVLSHESKINGWSSGTGQSTWSNPSTETSKEPKKIHITKYELNGLKVLVKHLSKLSGTKKNLPTLIRNSRALLDDCRKLIVEHENDDPELAVTGKPITLELLSVPVKADMNELIGQFFKPEESVSNNDSKNQPASMNSHSIESTNSSHTKSKLDNTSPTQRLKKNQSESAQKADEKKIISSSSAQEAHNDKEPPSKPSSPHKETKCLSPNKKSPYTTSSTASSNSSPPPRPKSPPTRPLSNNQYTSKTKNNNNLILPGSFADLIAATSTDSSSGSTTTASIFGVKEYTSTKPTSAHPSSSKTKSNNPTTPKGSLDLIESLYPSSNKTKDKDKTSSGITTSTSKCSNTSRPSQSVTTGISRITDTSSSTSGISGTNVVHGDQPLPPVPPKQPNSPEPPKTSVQKRFITPNSFRPPNKEKLIYASAPYISPVHASEQVRPSNSPYPWQTPTPNYSPSTPRHPTSSTVTSIPSSAALSSSIQPPTYSPANSQPVAQIPSNQISDSPKTSTSNLKHYDHNTDNHSNNNHKLNCAKETISNQKSETSDQQSLVSVKLEPTEKKIIKSSTSNHKSESSRSTQDGKQIPNQIKSSTSKQDSAKDQTHPTNSSSSVSKTQTETSDKLPPTKKSSAKPKCPPKKSKEARQVLEQSEFQAKPAVATSVIKLGTVSSLKQPENAAAHLITPIAAIPAIKVPETAPTTSSKPKPKRTKKQKVNDNNVAPTTEQAKFPSPTLYNTQRPQQSQVICGLVAPPASSASNIKTTPQSYLISRPLIFNQLPGYSTPQFQPVSRVPVPLLTSMASPLGMPLQQGARIVWATTPPRLPSQPGVSSSSQASIVNLSQNSSTPSSIATTPATTKSNDKSRPSTSQLRQSCSIPDNTALLSLATTALSTAPMMSSSSMTHINTRPAAQQAFMVNTGPNQQALYAAGQQLFRPFMQMPMTRLVTHPGMSGGARPPQSGQLVFARIPNQNQQRYLITPPGFIQQRFLPPQMNHPNQPHPTLAFATVKPPTSEASKPMKTKKVKTN